MSKKFSIEDALQRIQEISDLMQEEDVSLEQSLKLFEEGAELIKKSQQYLDEAELRVKKIINRNAPEVMEDFGKL
jgi:exodeoxyribonuclease VII small subunit